MASTLHHPHVRIRYNRRFKHTRDREDDILDLRGFISVKGVKAIGNKLSTLPVTEVTLEPVMEELEQAHERELQTAREADAAREMDAEQLPPEITSVSAGSDEGAEAESKPATSESVNDAGQASLF